LRIIKCKKKKGQRFKDGFIGLISSIGSIGSKLKIKGDRFEAFFLDRIYRISWIFSFGRSPDESTQTPIASGE
jgi:hypothetical protein